MQITSSAFSDGDDIPRRHTCDGDDISPPLAWSQAPAGAKSFALLCADPDAPGTTWYHWAAYDIPAEQSSLPEGVPPHAADFKQAVNDFHRTGYGGPCPPHGHGTHHYHFRLLALSIAHLALAKEPTCRDVEREARKHVMVEASLIGLYKR